MCNQFHKLCAKFVSLMLAVAMVLPSVTGYAESNAIQNENKDLVTDIFGGGLVNDGLKADAEKNDMDLTVDGGLNELLPSDTADPDVDSSSSSEASQDEIIQEITKDDTYIEESSSSEESSSVPDDLATEPPGIENSGGFGNVEIQDGNDAPVFDWGVNDLGGNDGFNAVDNGDEETAGASSDSENTESETLEPQPLNPDELANLTIGASENLQLMSVSDINLSVTLGASQVGQLKTAVDNELKTYSSSPSSLYANVVSLTVSGGALSEADFDFMENNLVNLADMDLGASDCYGQMWVAGGPVYGTMELRVYSRPNSTLKKLVMPMSLKHIGKQVFDNCSALEELVLNNTCFGIVNNPTYYLFSASNAVKKITVVYPGASLDDLDYTGWYMYMKPFERYSGTRLSTVEAYVSNGSETKRVTSDFDGHTVVVDSRVMPSGTNFYTGLDNALASAGGISAVRNQITDLIVRDVEVDFSTVYNFLKNLRNADLSEALNTTVPASALTGLPIERIALPSGITSIGANAFKNCSALTSIEIPAGVTKIDTMAFEGCTGLKLLSASPSVGSWGSGMFEDTPFKTDPSSCTLVIDQADATVSDWVDFAQKVLTISTVGLGTNVQDAIGVLRRCRRAADGSFEELPLVPFDGILTLHGSEYHNASYFGLTVKRKLLPYGSFPDTAAAVTELNIIAGPADLAFIASSFPNLQRLNLRESTNTSLSGLTSLSALSEVNLPKSFSIASNTFQGCTSLTTVTLDENTVVSGSADGFSGTPFATARDTCRLIVDAGGPVDYSVAADFSAKLFGAGSTGNQRVRLYQNVGGVLTRLIPENFNLTISAGDVASAGSVSAAILAQIGGYDESGDASALYSKVIGVTFDGVSIDADACSVLRQMPNLEEIIPSSGNEFADDTIPDGAFEGLSKLKMSIPAGVKKIGAAAFKNTAGDTSLVIPVSVEGIGKDAFGGWTMLEDISINYRFANPGKIISSPLKNITIDFAGYTKPFDQVKYRDVVQSSAYAALTPDVNVKLRASMGSLNVKDVAPEASLPPAVLVDGQTQIAAVYASGAHIITIQRNFADETVEVKKQSGMLSFLTAQWETLTGDVMPITLEDRSSLTLTFRVSNPYVPGYSDEVTITLKADDAISANSLPAPVITVDGEAVQKVYASGEHHVMAVTKVSEGYVQYQDKDALTLGASGWLTLGASGIDFTLADGESKTYLFRTGTAIDMTLFSPAAEVTILADDAVLRGEIAEPEVSLDGSAAILPLYQSGTHVFTASTSTSGGYVEYKEKGLLSIWRRMAGGRAEITWDDNVQKTYLFRAGSDLRDGVYSDEVEVSIRVHDGMLLDPIHTPDVLVDGTALARLYLSGDHEFTATTQYPEEWIQYRLQSGTEWEDFVKDGTAFTVPDNTETTYVFRCGNDLKPGEHSDEITVMVKTNDAVYTGNTPLPVITINGDAPQLLYGLGGHTLEAATDVEEGFVEYREDGLFSGGWKKIDPAGSAVDWTRDNVNMTYRFRVGSALKDGVYGPETSVTFRVYDEMYRNPVNPPSSVLVDSAALERLYLSGTHQFMAATKYPEEWVQYRLQNDTDWKDFVKDGTSFTVPDNTETTYVFRCGNDLKPGEHSGEITVMVKTNDAVYTGNTPLPAVTINGEAPQLLYGLGGHTLEAATGVEEGFVEYREDGLFSGGWKKIEPAGSAVDWTRDNVNMTYRFRVGSALKDGVYGPETSVTFRVYDEMYRSPVNPPSITVDSASYQRLYLSGGHAFNAATKYPEEWVEYRPENGTQWMPLDKNSTAFTVPDNAETTYVFRCGNDLKPGQTSEETSLMVKTNDMIFTGNAPAPTVTINDASPLPLYGHGDHWLEAVTGVEEGFVEYREAGLFKGGWKTLDAQGENLVWQKDQLKKTYRFRVGSALKPGVYGHEGEVSFRIFDEMYRNPVTTPTPSIDGREEIDVFYPSGVHTLGVRMKYPEEWVEYRVAGSGEWQRFDLGGQDFTYADVSNTVYDFRAGNDLKPGQYSEQAQFNLRADDTLFGYHVIIEEIAAELTTDEAVWEARFVHPMSRYAASIDGVVDLYDDVTGSELLSSDLSKENIETVNALAERVCTIFSEKAAASKLTADEEQRKGLEELYDASLKTAHLPYSSQTDREAIELLYNSLKKVDSFETTVQAELETKEEFTADDSGMVLETALTYLNLEDAEKSAVIPERCEKMNEAVGDVFNKAWYDDVRGLDANGNASSKDDVLIKDREKLEQLKEYREFDVLRGTTLPYVPEPGSTVDEKITFIDGDLDESLEMVAKLESLKKSISELPDVDELR